MGQKLVRRERMIRAACKVGALLLLALVVAACRSETPREPAGPRPAARRIPATVFTIQTTIVPGDRAYLHKVIVAGTTARIGNEVDRWRLFDIGARTVTTVDQIARTYRTQPWADLLRERRRLLATPMPPHVPLARLERGTESQVVAGVRTGQRRVVIGDYLREIWFSEEPTAADRLYPLIAVTDPIGQQYAGVMRNAFPQLIAENGFPMLDRSIMRFDGDESVVEKRVIRIEQTTVPAVWLELPPAFKDLTPEMRQATQ
ncbi:MAG: hypothetical protein ACYC7A_18760 [Thermoanaerobaculia bacterium]